MEDSAIQEVIKLCRETQVPCHIVHLGSGNSVQIIGQAQKEGVPITVETCHHYLNLCAETIPDASAQFKCCPPIRDRWHREKIWEAVQMGIVSLVVSDHAPCTADLKLASKVNLLDAWGGISSVQYGLPLMWSEGRKRGLTIQDVLRLMSSNPAKLASLEDRKGAIKVGHDADFVIWDPHATFTVEESDILHKNKLTPYLGWNLSGLVHETIVGGKTVYCNGKIIMEGPTPAGRLLL
jgi:allantoinase